MSVDLNSGSRADYGAAIFGRILPHRAEDLEYAFDRLTLEHFWYDRSGLQRTFWALLTDYWSKYREIFPPAYLTDLLTQNGVESSKILLLTTAYDEFVDAEVTEGQFRAAVDQMRSALDKQQTGQGLSTAFEILERGVDIDGRLWSGHADAREYVLSQISEIEQREVTEEAPEGDVRSEVERLMQLYDDVHGTEEIPGIEFGIPTLDKETSGVRPGELCLIAAYTSQGKSQVCAQMAWNTVVNQKRGIFFATTETVRDTTIRRIMSRHSRLAKFGLPDGLNAKHIQNGSLSDKERRIYFDVLQDFADISAPCHIAQLPANPTLDFVATRAARINQTFRVDLLLVDYLQLLKVPGPNRGEREAFNEILRDGKRLSTTFDKGRGVAVVSPWQIKQSAFHEALEAQSYTLGSLADTSEADKSPDLIVTLLRPSSEASSRLAKMQTLKHRDGPVLDPFDIEVDYRTSYLGQSGGQQSIGARPQQAQLSGPSSLAMNLMGSRR